MSRTDRQTDTQTDTKTPGHRRPGFVQFFKNSQLVAKLCSHYMMSCNQTVSEIDWILLTKFRISGKFASTPMTENRKSIPINGGIKKTRSMFSLATSQNDFENTRKMLKSETFGKKLKTKNSTLLTWLYASIYSQRISTIYGKMFWQGEGTMLQNEKDQSAECKCRTHPARHFPPNSKPTLILTLLTLTLQWLDTVGRVAGRASGL